MRTPAFALLAALLCAAGAPARADTLSDATQGWSTDIAPATDWEVLEFKDEVGEPQRLFYRTSDVKLGADPPAAADAPLFALDASPALEKRELSGGTAQVAVFRENQNKVSVYYVKAGVRDGSLVIGTGVDVSRRDKPELVLRVPLFKLDAAAPIDFSALRLDEPGAKLRLPALGVDKLCQWCAQGSPYAAPSDGKWTKDYVGKLKTIVHKPDAVKPGMAVPHTAGLDEGVCAGFDGFYTAPADTQSRLQQIWIGFTPAEVELQIAGLAPELAPASLYASQGCSDALTAVGDGKFKKVNDFVKAVRAKTQAAAAAQAAEMKKNLPEDRFTPFESRWLICRMRHVGGSVKQAAWDKLKALSDAPEASRAAAMKKYVAAWRGFLAAELEAYASESQGLPELPSKPDHAKLDKALHDRTKSAPGGSSVAASSLGGARVGPAQRRIVDDASARARDLLNN